MRKKTIAILLVLYLCLNVAFAFAFWDNTTRTDNLNLSLGEGVVLEVNEVIGESNQTLIPVNGIVKGDDVTEVVLNYNVQLDSETLEDLILNVEIENVMIGESLELGSLVNFEIIKASEILSTSSSLVTVKVTLSEPSNASDYQNIVSQPIKFTVKFYAT